MDACSPQLAARSMHFRDRDSQDFRPYKRVYLEAWYTVPPRRPPLWPVYISPTLQACPMKFLDLTSLTLDEFQRLIVPFEAAIQAHMVAWRLDRKPRTARRFTVYQNCPRPPPRIGHCLFSPMSRPTRRRPGTPVKHIVPTSPLGYRDMTFTDNSVIFQRL